VVAGHSDATSSPPYHHRPSSEEIGVLRVAHETVAAGHGDSPHFDGPHVLASDLASDPRECPDVPTVGVGRFHEQGRHEISPVAWHELARHTDVTAFASYVVEQGVAAT
jgi:hypothetical protein